MLYLDYSRGPGRWVPNKLGGRENLDAIDFLRQLNATIIDDVPTAMMIAEESTAWPKVTHPIEHGGLGFTHKWNLGWMHDTLGYFSTDPVHRRWHHRELSFGLLYAFSERFVLPMSHDEVVHGKGSLLGKMPGDDWQKFANLRAMFTWMWAMPGAPLVFMGAELAPWTEWNDAGGLPWHLLDHAPHRGVRDLLAELNRVAAQWRSLWERDHEPTGFQWLDADDALHSVVRLPALGPRRRTGCRLRRQLHAGAATRVPGRACRGRASGRCWSTPTAASSVDRAIAVACRPCHGDHRVHVAGPAGVGRVRPAATRSRVARGGTPVIEAWRDPRMRPVINASLTLGLAVGVFGVVVRCRRGQRRRLGRCRRASMSLLVFTGASAVLGGQRDRRRGIDCVGVGRGAAAGGAQRRLRAGDGSAPRPDRSAGGWSPRS